MRWAVRFRRSLLSQDIEAGRHAPPGKLANNATQSDSPQYFIYLKNGCWRPVDVTPGTFAVMYRGLWRVVFCAEGDEEYFAAHPDAKFRLAVRPSKVYRDLFMFRIVTRDPEVFATGGTLARESGHAPMNTAEFEEVALALIGRGYSPIPIIPGSKSPGERSPDGGWRSMSRWQKWCCEPVPVTRVEAWLRMIGDSEVGLGVACGRGLICIDIDQEYLLDPVLAILPSSPVQKKGRKGVSLFYRGDTEKIRSRNYRTEERVGLVDLLAEGKQTVLPPSIHPDTNESYFWWSDATLCDTPLSELPELPDDDR